MDGAERVAARPIDAPASAKRAGLRKRARSTRAQQVERRSARVDAGVLPVAPHRPTRGTPRDRPT
jgi:hypothetical protein